MPMQVLSFGAKAHRIVGYIAEQELCPEAKVAVGKVLDGEDLGEAGLWADRIRGYSKWDFAKPWHYINIPDDENIDDVRRRPEGDVLWAIEEMNRRLDKEDPASPEYAEALKFLIHFVADIHQPLHVGRREDLGGNRVRVTYYKAYGEPPGKGNLHAYWDTDALDLEADDPEVYAQQLMQNQSSKQVRWWPGSSRSWIAEDMLLRQSVYDFKEYPEAGAVYLNSGYLERTQAVLGQRLYLAGRRLGAMLNDRYCVAIESKNSGS
jgi:hypothetical protein